MGQGLLGGIAYDEILPDVRCRGSGHPMYNRQVSMRFFCDAVYGRARDYISPPEFLKRLYATPQKGSVVRNICHGAR